MPLTFKIDPARRLVITYGEGSVSLDDIRQQVADFHAHPDFNKDFSWLADVSSVTTSDASFSGFNQFLHGDVGDPFSENARRAMCAENDLVFGLCRMYQTLCGRKNFGVFRTRAEALGFLGLEDRDL